MTPNFLIFKNNSFKLIIKKDWMRERPTLIRTMATNPDSHIVGDLS